ncbi:protein-tyrosine phosphatase family protein [Leisingera sp. S232]|uniref:protein-tyrosine phosphatase family protein n=1 Tax=Leisingera sp. S232 TaxID=3415132 RepID=UPI003C7C2C58
MRSDKSSGTAVQEMPVPVNISIHEVPVAGGLLALCPLPGKGGDYAGDMGRINAWKPGLVISMTTAEEHAAAGSHRLGCDIQSMASRWIHLPVPDFDVPSPQVAAIWPKASASARMALEGGGRVLVHCQGGCGRSGMAVLRLMIESGEDPAQALERLRSVRPCAVETQAQLEWANAGRPTGQRPQ